MHKILAIGNSFSQDSTRYLMPIASSAGSELFVRNLFIGGCSLERHVQNLKSGEEAYDYEENASPIGRISLPAALAADDWDYITVQQVSGLSGVSESYTPFLEELITGVKAACPNAEIVFHRTWAYETNSTHGDFPRYNCNQQKMFKAIVNATKEQSEKNDLRIIPVGDFIQHLRSVKPFDFSNGGLSLNRDGFHLSLDYGRYAAGLTWFHFFTGLSVSDVTFAPDNADASIISTIREEAARFFVD